MAGLATTAVAVTFLAVSQAIDFGVFRLRYSAFNADHHASVLGIMSLAAQAGAALACATRAGHAGRARPAWIVTALLLICLTIIRGSTAFNAAVLAGPLACVFGLLVWITRRDQRLSRTIIWIGLLTLSASLLLHRVGVDADSSTASDYTWGYQILGIVKHGAELAGWILLATGVTGGADAHASTQATAVRSPNAERTS